MMTPFEEELRKALARREPAPDFTARVLARCRPKTSKWAAIWQRLLPIAAVFLLIAGGTIYQQRQRELQGIAAKRQLVLAMHIAGWKLHDARQHVMELDSAEAQQ
jgi:hypothetical protein